MNTQTNLMNAPDAYARMAGTEKVQFKIGGMACSFCVASITKALGRMEGVRDVSVNLAHEETLIEYEPMKVAPAKLKETLLDLGYTVRDANKVRSFEEEEAEIKEQLTNLLTAAGFTAVALGAMALMWLDLLPPKGMAAMYWLMPILALSTVFGPGWHILTMAWASLRRGILNQHVLLEFGACGTAVLQGRAMNPFTFRHFQENLWLSAMSQIKVRTSLN